MAGILPKAPPSAEYEQITDKLNEVIQLAEKFVQSVGTDKTERHYINKMRNSLGHLIQVQFKLANHDH